MNEPTPAVLPTADAPTAEGIESLSASLDAIATCFESDGGLIVNAPPEGKARTSAIADLRWLSSHLPSLLAADADRQRMDWLQTTREPVYQGEDHIADVWGVHGQTDDVRKAIDAARAARSPEGEP